MGKARWGRPRPRRGGVLVLRRSAVADTPRRRSPGDMKCGVRLARADIVFKLSTKTRADIVFKPINKKNYKIVPFGVWGRSVDVVRRLRFTCTPRAVSVHPRGSQFESLRNCHWRVWFHNPYQPSQNFQCQSSWP